MDQDSTRRQSAQRDGATRSRLARVLRGLAFLVLAVATLVYLVFLLPFWGIPFNQSRHGRVPLTPPWALENWVWEDDVNTGAFVRELLDGYAAHDIPVRTIMIDSPWSHRYNDFKVDEQRYPDPERFFLGLQQDGYRVVLWMTPMVNSLSKDTLLPNDATFYEEARARGYLAGGAPTRWWKGKGGFIDYSNPEAVKWWHGLQQQVLDWGVDGWKLDGADTLFASWLGQVPFPFKRTHSGWMSTRRYMDHYARSEYQNGLATNPEFVTVIRSKDRWWTHPEGFAPLDAAPVTWVGDNRHTWKAEDRGIEQAITDILGSARLGYSVIGSDVAGYHGRSNPEDIGSTTDAQLKAYDASRTGGDAAGAEFGTAAGNNEIAPNIYIRWAQFSTFCGLFMNGGHGERRLWKRSRPELEIVRTFSWLHTEFVPYIYSHVVESHRGGLPLMRPLDEGRFHYLFGGDFLVAPIHEDISTRAVHLPKGSWRYLFDDREVLDGGRVLSREFPLDEYPVFVRDGAIVPLNVTRSYTGLGDRDSAGFTTWLIYPKGRNTFTLWHPDGHPTPASTRVDVDAGAPLRIAFSGRRVPHILRVFMAGKPSGVTLDGRTLEEDEGWTYDVSKRRLVVRTTDYTGGVYVITS